MNRNLRRLIKKHEKKGVQVPSFMPRLSMSRFEYERNEPTIFNRSKTQVTQQEM